MTDEKLQEISGINSLKQLNMNNKVTKKDSFIELTSTECRQINGGGWFKYAGGFIYESFNIAIDNIGEWFEKNPNIIPPSPLR